MKYQSILIVRLSAIGDVVHALPVLDALREAFPEARLGWLVEELSAPLLENHPYLDRVYVIPKKRWRKDFRGLWSSEIRPFFAGIKRDGWDATLDLQGLSKSALGAWASGARRRVGFAGPNAREVSWLLNNRRVRPLPADVHVVQQNLRLLEGLGVSLPERPPQGRLGIRDAERDAMREKLRASGWRGEPLLALNPGAGWVTKRWPPRYFAELGTAIASEFGLRPIILWGPGEESARDEMLAGLKDADGFAAPPTRIRELAVLISLTSTFVGGDTGPTHLAGLLGIPTVAIFGASDGARNHPWHSAKTLVVDVEGLACRPCWKTQCPLLEERHLACLTTLTPNHVGAKAMPWLMNHLPAYLK